jgi:PAS domain S-box-containing protein
MFRETLLAERRVRGRDLELLVRSPQFRSVLWFCLFGVAFYFAYHYGMSFSPACASPFWFPDTVLLCALLMSRPRNWWIFVLAPLPIRLFSPLAREVPTALLLATFAIDSVKGVLVATALRLTIKNPARLETVREFGQFCLYAVLLGPAVSAYAGAAVLHVVRGVDYWRGWAQWFMGDALTHLVVTPAILYWLFGTPWKMRMPARKAWMEGGLVTIGLIVTGYLAFSISGGGRSFAEPFFYTPVPLLFWAAIRFGMPGASGAIAIITFFSVNAAIHGAGPFFGRTPAGTALVLQQFLLLRAAPVYLVAILIQQKKGVERSLRESEERFRVMADTAPVLLWIAGTDKLCEFFNRGWLDFTGRTMKQELGYGWAEGVHPNDVWHCQEIYESCFEARRSFEIEYRLRRYDGEYRWVLDRGVPRYATDGAFVGYIGCAIDITDRKQAEETKQELVHVSRLAVMGEFTAMVAHELNQPLGAILSNTEAAEMLLHSQKAPLEEIGRILADIRHDDLRASEAISRFRALLRKREMEMQHLDMNEVVSEVLRLARGDALRRGVRIHNECRAALPVVRGDAVHLQQVLLNLILNGMDAVKNNVEAERHLFISTGCNEDSFVEVAVKDTGPGIPPECLSRVFESFYTTKPEGIGLGLSIARFIVQTHAGRLWAENNRDGRGATFRFTLPKAVIVPPPQPQSMELANAG